jgi:transposase InsO family protein
VRPVAAALAGRVPNWLVRRLLREIKRLHRARQRRRETADRLHVEVRARDVMWSMDGTHLARLDGGDAVEGQVVRETSTPKILCVEVGAPADGDAVVGLLERVARARGGLPLVLATDNGPCYVCPRVETWLADHGVVHLLSLPRTPRHNPWVERTNRELKEETGLGRGVVVNEVEDLRERVDEAVCRLDDVRLRARAGFRTAAAADADLTAWYNACTRERFLAAVCRRVAEALPGLQSQRARRRARREAIHASLEEFGLIERTRGGR